MVSAIISKVILVIFGTLYPAYRSYKAIKNKDVREYVKWMMYWIIFAFFTTAETFADFFLAWLPLYYEIKIVFIIWLLSPATKGSSILYRKFVHPRLQKHEKAIDKYISQAQRNSYATLMDVGKKGLSVATDTFIRTAVTGQNQLVETLKKYNSMQELRSVDTTDAPMQHRPVRMSLQQDAYFDPENDVDILERQYKAKRTQDYNRISEEPVDVSQLQHSQSDNVISFSTSNTEVIDKEPTSFSGGEIEHTSGYMYDTSNMSKSYDGTYSSATLPRMRRQKKPIYETMPTQRTTRTRRSSKKQ